MRQVELIQPPQKEHSLLHALGYGDHISPPVHSLVMVVVPKEFVETVKQTKMNKKCIQCVSVLQYSQLDQLSVGSVCYAEEDGKLLPLVICKEYYKQGSGKHSEETYDIDAQTEPGYCCYSFVHSFYKGGGQQAPFGLCLNLYTII